MKVQPSEELVYWLGAIQADGCLKFYKTKRGYIDIRLCLDISKGSLPMLNKVRQITCKLFNRNGGLWKSSNRNLFYYHICVKQLLKDFDSLDIKFNDPPKPPKWCLKNNSLFGAYLAGLIDGDGCIWLLKTKWKGIECRVKITNSEKQDELVSHLKRFLSCKIRLTKENTKHAYNVEFLISRKNIDFIKKFVLPYINISYKKKRIEHYIVHLAAIV